MAAAVLCSIEFAISQATNPDFQLGRFLALMMLFHSLIGIGESLISGGVIRFVATRRPELLYHPPASSGRPWRRTLAAGLATAVVVALLLSPLASSAPDGLEAAVQHSELRAAETPSLSLFGGYDQVLGNEGWESWSVVLSGLIGTLVVFGIALVLGRPLETTPNPAPGAPRG